MVFWGYSGAFPDAAGRMKRIFATVRMCAVNGVSAGRNRYAILGEIRRPIFTCANAENRRKSAVQTRKLACMQCNTEWKTAQQNEGKAEEKCEKHRKVPPIGFRNRVVTRKNVTPISTCGNGVLQSDFLLYPYPFLPGKIEIQNVSTCGDPEIRRSLTVPSLNEWSTSRAT